MEKHFCMACGKEFEAESKNVRYCPECKAAKAAAQKEKAKQYVKERNARLNLTTAMVYKEDKETIQAIAKEQKKTFADVIHAMIASKTKKNK